MIRIGVICPSEIAFRRFMPALEKKQEFSFAGVAVNSIKERFGKDYMEDADSIEIIKRGKEKAQKFIEMYGGKLYGSYEELVTSPEIDAVYIPLPPALHYKWAKAALEAGKHVMVEKPATTCYSETKELIALAEEKKLAFHENYMFVFHQQIKEIGELIEGGTIGEVRLQTVKFGFPKRAKEDFRYDKKMGGGALMDAGGYTIKYASMLLSSNVHVAAAQSGYTKDFEVDMYGSGMLIDDKNHVVCVAYGMDNNYKCELEIWGSEGTLIATRVLTAPDGFTPTAVIKKGNTEYIQTFQADDAFLKSIFYFEQCIKNENKRNENYASILKQAELVGEFQKLAEKRIKNE